MLLKYCRNSVKKPAGSCFILSSKFLGSLLIAIYGISFSAYLAVLLEGSERKEFSDVSLSQVTIGTYLDDKQSRELANAFAVFVFEITENVENTSRS